MFRETRFSMNVSISKRILLIIPCYNESKTIGRLLREIQELNNVCDTVVIDDGSEDETHPIAKQLSPCLKLVANLGIGGAVQTGIKYALEMDYDFCIQVDGDGQHPSNQIIFLFESYLSSPANIIIGSRFLSDGDFRSTWARQLGIRVIRFVIHCFFGRKFTDPTSGFRIMDRKAIRLFSEEYPLDFPEPISLAVALEHGLTVREVPVNMRAREDGRSSISGIKSILYMLRVIGYLFLIRMDRHI